MSNNKQKPKQSPVKVKAPSNYVGVPRKVRNYFLLEIYEDQKNSVWNSHQRERLLSGPTKNITRNTYYYGMLSFKVISLNT